MKMWYCLSAGHNGTEDIVYITTSVLADWPQRVVLGPVPLSLGRAICHAHNEERDYLTMAIHGEMPASHYRSVPCPSS